MFSFCDSSQCLVSFVETPPVLGGGALPLLPWLPIKGLPELQSTPAEEPETAHAPPTASASGTMKISAAALAVILTAAALCTPSPASPCKSRATAPLCLDATPPCHPSFQSYCVCCCTSLCIPDSLPTRLDALCIMAGPSEELSCVFKDYTMNSADTPYV